MHKRALHLFFAAALLGALPSWATHPENPIFLKQEANGQPIATTAILPSGTQVKITATAPAATNGNGTYELEIELRPAAQPFTNTPTHSGGVILNKSFVDVEWSGLLVVPTDGQWKWQCRMKTTSTGNWVQFNGGNTAFTIAPPNVPDILVDNVALSSVTSDQTKLEFVVDASFKNRGSVSTGNFVWKAYLSSQNNVLDSSDQLIFTATTPIDVPATSTGTASSSLITLVPAPPPGTYYVIVEADPATTGCTSNCGDVSEFDEQNNVGAMPNYFVKGVDLVATSISNGPLNAGPGNQVTLQINFFNQGVETPQPNDPVEFRIVASRDQTVDSGDYEVYQNFVSVGGAQVFNMPVTFALPSGIAGGDVYWALEVDPPRQNDPNPTAEALETNNKVVSSATTHIQQADLEATSADMVHSTTGISLRKGDMGQPGKIVVNVKNVGDFLANPYDVGVMISENNTPSLSSDFRFADVPVTGIAAGVSGTVELAFNFPSTDKNGNPLVQGNYFFFIQLDSFNTIDELNESNNTRMITGPVLLREAAPDYAITSVVAPAQISAGERITLSRTIKNVGFDAGPMAAYACYASVNTIVTTSDYHLQFVDAAGALEPERMIQLNAGAFDSASELVQVPGNVPGGKYYVGCLVDPANSIVELEESNNASSTTAQVQVVAQAFRIATQQVPDGIVGTPYSFKLTAINATGPVTWTAVTSPPEGIGLGADGTLSGTPTEVAITTFRVRATDGRFSYDAVLVQRTMAPTSQLTITTDNLPPLENRTSIPYQAVLSASGGAQPYTWTILSGSLPNGISLDATTGALSGSPKPGLQNGEIKLLVSVRDVLGNLARKEIRLRVLAAGALAITSLTLPDALVNGDYIADLAAEVIGGAPLSVPLTWSVAAGVLPEGLTLSTHVDQSTGLLQGKATVAGTYAFTLQVQDSDGRADTADFVVRIFPAALKVTLEAPLPSPIHPGDAPEFKITSTSTAGAKYRLFSGALPAGLTLAEDGKVTGTIAEEGTLGLHSFVVEATDATGAKGLGAFAVEVVSRPAPQGCASTGEGPAGALLLGFALLGLMALGAHRRAAAVRAAVSSKRA